MYGILHCASFYLSHFVVIVFILLCLSPNTISCTYSSSDNFITRVAFLILSSFSPDCFLLSLFFFPASHKYVVTMVYFLFVLLSFWLLLKIFSFLFFLLFISFKFRHQPNHFPSALPLLVLPIKIPSTIRFPLLQHIH